MKRIISGSLLICFLVMITVSGYAQETPEAKKMEGHTWHQVVMVKFKPGTMSDAKEIIKDHFMQAGIESGVPGPEIMEFRTGKWDLMFVWEMDAITDMNWEVSPEDEKWWAAMAEQEGSMEKAEKLMEKYVGMVDEATSYLATTHESLSPESTGSN